MINLVELPLERLALDFEPGNLAFSYVLLDCDAGDDRQTQVAPIRYVPLISRSVNSFGFLALSLSVLIATPIARVFGSLIAFIYERDWRYARITLVVFLIVLTSMVLGRG